MVIGDMVLEQPSLNDVEAIWQMFSDAKALMKEMAIEQWQGDYPSAQTPVDDITNGENCFVVRDGKDVLGYAVLCFKYESLYGSFKGKWQCDERPYGTVRRIVTCQREKRHGVATFIMQNFIQMCVERGVKSLRTYTHANNAPMRGLAEKLGFTYVGNMYLACGAERVTYEKLIDV